MSWLYNILNFLFGYKKPKKVKQFNVELVDE